MITTSREVLSFRTLCVLPPILFAPTLVSHFVAPGAVAIEYTGILFHLCIMVVISRMDSPLWAKAAGFGWITLDVLSGMLTINEIPADLASTVRLAGHVLAGVWFVTASLQARPKSVRIVGTLVGVSLGLSSFLGAFLPAVIAAPSGLLLPVWFLLLAWKYEPGMQNTRTRNHLPAPQDTPA
ncbi:hypothetical protein [Streptomyces sp. NPDC058401]|uniref:hypothetical protein n=1 Tax=Streptomyces sp. NPDC058401 TaxID=3346480 RepID=UPI0036575259